MEYVKIPGIGRVHSGPARRQESAVRPPTGVAHDGSEHPGPKGASQWHRLALTARIGDPGW
jgi:hypothetical protein